VQIRAQEVGPEKEADRRSLFLVLLSNYDFNIVLESRKSHLFDGQTVTKETAAFQLCDITDPMLKEMIEDPEDLREECNVGLSSSGSADQLTY
jgi:general transcription factor 3C polypeptide 5 (transcription factor C subunit 1)